MQYWKIGVKGTGLVKGANASNFAEACRKCGWDWQSCYVIKIF